MLATVDQVGAILGVDSFTAEEEARLVELIGLVQGSITDALGRNPEAAVYTDVVLSASQRSAVLLLPHFPLASVEAVSEDETGLSVPAYAVALASGILTRLDGGLRVYWHAGQGAVVVSYTSATIAELSALCAQIVARTFNAGKAAASVPSVMAGFTQLTVGRWSGTAKTGAAGDPVAAINLTETELATVQTWRDRLA
jgi:hypothetical protein